MFWKTLRSLRIKTSEFERDEAEALAARAKQTLLPHQQWPVTLTREGSRWVCSYPCHPDQMQCVTAYGDSPNQACTNFDQLWFGTDLLLEFPNDEEEEF